MLWRVETAVLNKHSRVMIRDHKGMFSLKWEISPTPGCFSLPGELQLCEACLLAGPSEQAVQPPDAWGPGKRVPSSSRSSSKQRLHTCCVLGKCAAENSEMNSLPDKWNTAL